MGALGLQGSRFGDCWIDARPTPTTATVHTRRHTETHTCAHRQTCPHGQQPGRHPLSPRHREGLAPSLTRSLAPSPFPKIKHQVGQLRAPMYTKASIRIMLKLQGSTFNTDIHAYVPDVESQTRTVRSYDPDTM